MRKFQLDQIVDMRHRTIIMEEPIAEVAKEYKTSRSTVTRISRGETYKDIPNSKKIPGFPNYMVYPNGQVWSTTTNRFLAQTNKGRDGTAYYQLRNGDARQSIKVDSLMEQLFS